MRRSAFKLLAALLLALLPFISSAQIIYTGLSWLRYTQEARGGGMGGLGLATSPDPASALWNMGKPVMEPNSTGAVFTFVPNFDELNVQSAHMASLAGYYKLGDEQAITASLRYFSLGKQEFTDLSGNKHNANAGRDFGIDVGYSRRLSKKMGLGIALRYINSNLAAGVTQNAVEYGKGSAIAADLGWYYDGKNASGNGITVGLALVNLGSKISYTDNKNFKDFIPANLGLGANYTRKFNDRNQISFGVDINKLLVPTPPENPTAQQLQDYRNKGVVGSWFSSFGDVPDGFSEELKEFQVSVGGEYWYNNQFAFRAGYFFEDKNKGNRRYFTVGVGAKYNAFGFNFSYLVPSGGGSVRNPLSNTMRFSLLFDLGGGSGKK